MILNNHSCALLTPLLPINVVFVHGECCGQMHPSKEE